MRHGDLRASFISNGNSIKISFAKDDISLRERLKLLGAKWDRDAFAWRVTDDIPLVRKAVLTMLKFLPVVPVPDVFPKDDLAVNILSRWKSEYEGSIVIHDDEINRESIVNAWECAREQDAADKLLVVCQPKDVARWEFACPVNSSVTVVTCEQARKNVSELLFPGTFLVLDNVCAGKFTQTFRACSVLSLASVFRVVMLHRNRIKNIEDIENTVLLCDPKVCPSWDFFQNHVTVRKNKYYMHGRTVELTQRKFRNVTDFAQRISPVTIRNFTEKQPVRIYVKLNPVEKHIVESIGKRNLKPAGIPEGVKTPKRDIKALREMSLAVDGIHKDIPEGYRTAKEEKLIRLLHNMCDAVVLVARREVKDRLAKIVDVPVYTFGEARKSGGKAISFDVPVGVDCDYYLVTDAECDKALEKKLLTNFYLVSAVGGCAN